MHDIEKLKQANERSLAVAVEENRIALALPLMPRRVGFGLETQPWVTYEVDTLAEALDIFKLYEPEPWVLAKDGGCSVLNTEAYIEERYNKSRAGKQSTYEVTYSVPEGAPYFDCTQGVGYGDTEMEFFTKAADRTLKIIVRIAASPIQVTLLVMDAYSRTPREKYRKSYPGVPGARCIKWGYGEDYCKGTYWFPDLETFWAAMEHYEAL